MLSKYSYVSTQVSYIVLS